APVVVVGRVAMAVPAPALIEDLAVGVELELAGGRVAGAGRRGAAISLEMIELYLAQAALAFDPEQNLEVVGVAGGAALDEAPEPVGLIDVTELGEGVRREGRVADPAE